MFCVTVARDDVLQDEPDENVVVRDVPKDISRLQLRWTKLGLATVSSAKMVGCNRYLHNPSHEYL